MIDLLQRAGIFALNHIDSTLQLFKEPVNKRVRRHIPTEIQEGETSRSLNVPVYHRSLVPPFHCARYVRYAARDLFDISFPSGDAWNLRYTVEKTELIDVCLGYLSDARILTPGTIIGLFNPKSTYNQGLDERGEKRKYTHVALFLGQDPTGVPLFAEQRGPKTMVSSPYTFRMRGNTPIEMLFGKQR